MFGVYSLLLVLPLISAQVERYGYCPIPCVTPNFDINRYLGTWFEIAKIPNPFTAGKCVLSEYYLAKGGTHVINRLYRIKDGQFSTDKIIIRVYDKSEPAKLELQLTEGGPFIPKWILYTDYKTYVVLYTCENHYPTHSQYAWILGRTPTLDKTILSRIKRALVKQGIFADAMEATDQYCFTGRRH